MKRTGLICLCLALAGWSAAQASDAAEAATIIRELGMTKVKYNGFVASPALFTYRLKKDKVAAEKYLEYYNYSIRCEKSHSFTVLGGKTSQQVYSTFLAESNLGKADGAEFEKRAKQAGNQLKFADGQSDGAQTYYTQTDDPQHKNAKVALSYMENPYNFGRILFWYIDTNIKSPTVYVCINKGTPIPGKIQPAKR